MDCDCLSSEYSIFWNREIYSSINDFFEYMISPEMILVYT